MDKRIPLAIIWLAAFLTAASEARAQLSNLEAPVVVGHYHLNVTSVEEHRRFWVDTLGGEYFQFGEEGVDAIRFPGVFVFLTEQPPTGPTRGTTFDHLGFAVPDVPAVARRAAEAGYARTVGREPGPGQPDNPPTAGSYGRFEYLLGPDGVKVELVTAEGADAPPIAYHHVHFVNRDFVAMQQWYIRALNATPRPGPEYDFFAGADLPGVGYALNFFSWLPEEDLLGTAGRAVDHVGFEVRDLETFVGALEARGIELTEPYHRENGIGVAKITDPWGTVIELTEGLREEAESAGRASGFDAVYRAYLDALETGDLGAATAAAEAALEAGRAVFGETHRDTANLYFNYASMLEAQGFRNDAEAAYGKALEINAEVHGPDSPEQIPVLMRLGAMYRGGFGQAEAEPLQRALAIQRAQTPDDLPAYAELAVEAARLLTRSEVGRPVAREFLEPLLAELEAAYGKGSGQLVPVLMALGKARADVLEPRDQIELYRRALDIAEELNEDDPLSIAALELEIGRDLFYLSRSVLGGKYLNDALRTFENELGPADEQTALAALSLGEVRHAERAHSKARGLFETALAFYAGKPAYRSEEIRVRSNLVRLYEAEGEGDEATPHVLELARLSVVSSDQEYQPFVKVAPNYPTADIVAGNQGYVIVQYTVDEIGRTRDTVVVESDASPAMRQAALDSVRLYRYLPRVVDGEAVATPEVSTRIEFQLAL